MDVRGRINSAFFVDLFQMISQSDRRQITATEVERKHEEKLLVLGPVLERSQNEVLDPLIDNAFNMALREGLFPPPPEEMMGMDIRVEYVSMLAQAQKAIGISALDRMIGTVGTMAQVKPDVIDKLDSDKIVDEYSQMLGVPSDLIIANEQVAIIREDREKEQQQMQQAAEMAEVANTAKTLGDTKTEDKSLLTDVAQQFTQL